MGASFDSKNVSKATYGLAKTNITFKDDRKRTSAVQKTLQENLWNELLSKFFTVNDWLRKV